MDGGVVAPLMTNGMASNGASEHSGKSEHKKHKKEKKHKEHKEHKHKKDKKEKHKEKHKDKNRDKDEKKKSKHKDKEASVLSTTVQAKPEPVSPTKIKSEEKLPTMMISETVAAKQEPIVSDDDMPLASSSRKRPASDNEDDVDYKPATKKVDKKPAKKSPARAKPVAASARGKKGAKQAPVTPDKKKTKRELAREKEEKEVWKWWEEDRKEDGRKWKTLEHRGPLFAPAYERMPSNVKFLYDGKEVTLSNDAEEVATFYAKMLLHDYTSKEVFNSNFLKDWRKVMTAKERELIKDLKKCDFRKMNEHFTAESEARKNRSKEEKQKTKEENEAIVEEYGYCLIDGHKEKIGNFRIEPPGLFRGRGDHPKMGMLKKRVNPEDVTINCGKDGKRPEAPAGRKWKEVRHDNLVTWLASWTENVQQQNKYVMLNPASRLKGEKDWQKYEKARKLHKIVDRVRDNYQQDLKSKEMRIRQRAVALYFIDKLALRAGNEKDSDEQADTVGCCSLRVEHITLHEQQDDKENVVEFDFLGKDSIRYQNSVSVDKKVFKNVKLFMESKAPGDDLFDRLNTTILNKHLQDIMEGLTAKVFRTYNASRTLEEQLNLLTKENDNVAAKMLSYNRANRAVAVLCNHQRAVPKNFSLQMERLNEKIAAKKKDLKNAQKELKDAKGAKGIKSGPAAIQADKKKKAVERIKDQLHKLEVQATDKDENKDIALGTSKLNYLDPRISVAWVKKHEVPIEKVYNKTQRQKFMWAVDMAGPDFVFAE